MNNDKYNGEVFLPTPTFVSSVLANYQTCADERFDYTLRYQSSVLLGNIDSTEWYAVCYYPPPPLKLVSIHRLDLA